MNDEQHQDIGKLRPQYQTYDRQKCFIAYSEQAYWSADLLGACEQVLSKPEFNLEPDYARKHFASDVPLRQKALELIANAQYGIYDLSCWRADDRSPWQMPCNVFIELGMAIALNRPTLLLRHSSNKEAGLELPNCLQCLSEQILEFSGKHSLEKVLQENLPKWVNTTPEQAWWNRHCIFGGRVCEHRETHPGARKLGLNTLNCSIADGADISRPDFREIVEDVLRRFNDVNYTYLDGLSLEKGYSFLLCTYCQKVRSSPFAIYRITLKTPSEAFIAIGMSLALEIQFECKIPKILITEDMQIVPTLLSGYEVVVARSDREKKDSLRKFMPTVIKKVKETTWKPRPLPFLIESIKVLEVSKIDKHLLHSDAIEEENHKSPLVEEDMAKEAISRASKRRRITYTASPQGIERAEKAMLRLGFNSKTNFAQSQRLARNTVIKFFQSQPIQLDLFKRICDALELNWAEIAGISNSDDDRDFTKSKTSSILPFEFIVGKPFSFQLKNRNCLQAWKEQIRQAAADYWQAEPLIGDEIQVVITHYYDDIVPEYEAMVPDSESMYQLIRDALFGIIYIDNYQITEFISRRCHLNALFIIKRMSPVLQEGVGNGEEFFHIRIDRPKSSRI